MLSSFGSLNAIHDECLMFNLLYKQLADTPSMRSRMDTHPPLRHFVTVRNRPWFGTHADHIKTSKCSKPKLLSCWFLWWFRVSTESCCVNCLYVQILAFCRLRGTDYNVSLQCNQTLEPAGDRKLNNFNSVIKNLVPEYFKPYCIFFLYRTFGYLW